MSDAVPTTTPTTTPTTAASTAIPPASPSGRRPARLPRLLSEPMWVLGLVVLVDEIDENIVRGMITPLVTLRSALGFGQAVTEPSAASLLGDYYPPEHRGRAFSIQQVMLLLGTGLGVAIGGGLAAAFNWRVGLLVAALLGLGAAVLVFRLREPRRGSADLMAAIGGGTTDPPDQRAADADPMGRQPPQVRRRTALGSSTTGCAGSPERWSSGCATTCARSCASARCDTRSWGSQPCSSR